MWSGKLPDDVETHSLGNSIIDASIKRKMLLKYGLRPWEMDKIPIRMFTLWTLMDAEEAEKDRVKANTG